MQAKIDVKDWGNTLPSLCDPGYMICIFQNIGLQPLGGYEPKTQHKKKAVKALGPQVSFCAKHCLNKRKFDAGHTLYKCQQESIEGTYTYLVNNKHWSDTFTYHQLCGTAFSLDADFKQK